MMKIVKMTSTCTFFLSIIATYGGWTYAYTLNDTKRLYEDLMTGYDKTIRPIWNQTQPLQVTISFSLLSINFFDEVHHKFSTMGHLYVVWHDELLRWNMSEYNGIQRFTSPQNKLWCPIIGLASPVDEFKIVGEGIFPLFVQNDGTVTWTPGDIFVSSCKADITYYPFDRHTCSVDFAVLNGDKSSIYVNLLKQTIDLSQFEINGEWDIVSTKAIIVDVDTGIVFQKCQFTIDMKRKPLFFVIHFIGPIFFISLLNASVGMLPSDSGEKVSFSVTVFLAFVVFIGSFSGRIPETSDSIAYISIILDLQMISSMLSVFFTVALLNVGLQSNANPVSCRIARFTRMVNRFRYNNQKDGGSALSIPKIRENKVHSNDKINAVEETSKVTLEREITLTWKIASEAMNYVLFRILFLFNLMMYISTFSIYTNHVIISYYL